MTVLGIHIGSTRVRAGRVDERGEVHSSRTDRVASDPDALITTLHYIVAAGEPPDGVGVTCNGPENPLLETVAHLIEPALHRRVAVQADEATRAALLAESVWGAARGHANVVLINLDKSVGGAAMVDGALLRGRADAAARMGHVTVDPDGPLCRCGARGCLEALATTRAIEGEMMAALHRGCASKLARKRADLDWRAILDASDTDPLAGAVVERAARSLAAALAGLGRLLNPEIILIGGALASSRFRDRLSPELAVAVATPELKDPTGVIAAAALAMRPNARAAMPK